MDSWIIEYVAVPLAGVAVGFAARIITTPRERKKSDLELVNSAITPLLESIKELTEQNSCLVGKLADEQRKVLEYMNKNRDLLTERAELIDKIDKLSKQVEALKKMIRERLNGQEDKQQENKQ